MAFTPPPVLPASVPLEGPCQPWTDLATERARCNIPDTEITDEAFEFGITLASRILWAASGRRYGLCRSTVRPCYCGSHTHGFTASSGRRRPSSYPPGLTVATEFGVDYAAAWPIYTGCGCTLPELILPGPVAHVEAIMADGVAMDLTPVRIRTHGLNSRRAIYRVDGESWWCCQQLDEDPTTVPANPRDCPAWSVTYWRGRPVPAEAQTIAGMLAEQMARVFCGAKCDSGITPGLTRVARRGIVKEYDPASLKDENGKTATGLPAVDAWVETVNPSGLRRASSIIRADDPTHRNMWQMVSVV